MNPETGKCRPIDLDTCYSPEQNLDIAEEAGAIGCPCNPETELETCRAGVALSCKGDRWSLRDGSLCAATGCSVTREVPFPPAEERTANFRIARSGSSFVLTDWDFISSQWASATTLFWSGAVSETKAGPSNLTLGVAALQRDGGHELIVVTRGDGVLLSTGWRLGSSEPDEQSSLFSAVYHGQVSLFHSANSLDGKRAAFAFGNRVNSPEIQVAVFGTGGVPVAPAHVVEASSTNWQCVQLFPTTSAITLSVFAQAEDGQGDIDWHVSELDANGSVVFEGTARIPGTTTLPNGGLGQPGPGCPPVVQTAAGYYTSTRLDDGTGHIAVMRRDRALDAAVELVPLPFPTGDSNLLLPRFGLLMDTFAFLRSVNPGLVVERVDEDGASTRLPLQVPDGASDVAFVAAEGEALYVRYTKGETPYFAEVTCVP